MQAIHTYFLAASNTRGPRIVAKCDAGKVIVPYSHEGDEQHAHAIAAMELVRSLGWAEYCGQWACGGIDKGDYVFVNITTGTFYNPTQS